LCFDSKFIDGSCEKKFETKVVFSNLVSFCRIHLFNYIHLTKFRKPRKDWELDGKSDSQLGLFDDYLATG
jgi:hypothetical protein